jgi:hypothetical protein
MPELARNRAASRQASNHESSGCGRALVEIRVARRGLGTRSQDENEETAEWLGHPLESGGEQRRDPIDFSRPGEG